MHFDSIGISGAWVWQPDFYTDERGSFEEVFQIDDIFEKLGYKFHVKQINESISRKGVLRGIHWADNPPGQSKFVRCLSGKVLDFVVDLRQESATFNKCVVVELDSKQNKSVLITEGLGHGFLSLEDGSKVSYLCSEKYSPSTERVLSVFDPTLKIDFKSIMLENGIGELILSPKDSVAPDLAFMMKNNLLPN